MFIPTADKKTNLSFHSALNINTIKQKNVDVHRMINNAAQCIAPVWPMETFIACNPLNGLEYLPFEQALLHSQQLLNVPDAIPNLERVNRELIKWCSVFLDMGQGTITAPHRDKGFYQGFLSLSRHDHRLHQGSKTIKSWLHDLPQNPEESILLCLKQLGVKLEAQDSFIEQNLAYLPGFAGYIKWASEWKNPISIPNHCPVTLVDFMAVRLILTTVLWPEAALEYTNNKTQKKTLDPIIANIKSSEQKYQDKLITDIIPQIKNRPINETRPDAQLVFCIDVRSEPFRRSIESLGAYETLGFAGFFGIPVRIHDINSDKIKESCPVLLKPLYTIQEKPILSTISCIEQSQHGKKHLKEIKNLYHDLKYNFSTPFTLVEALGPWCGITMLAKSLFPQRTQELWRGFIHRLKPTLPTQPIINRDNPTSLYGIPEADQAVYAETVLKMMGLTQHFAKAVIFCGHRSSTENNPYASSLDCGACGGNHGGSNAKIIAALLNIEAIRDTLRHRGINIPKDTMFYAAEHDTTTDEMTLYETEYPLNKELLHVLKKDLTVARTMNTKARCQNFNLNTTSNSIKSTLRRSADWAEVRPEWGLAGNASFIIGPRDLTKTLHLEGRAFLHSYDWTQDDEGTYLETILTAPMVVAEWINTQYLFSTLNNTAYGSGNKITHNVTGKIGVMQGNASDLMHGLPLQSVMANDKDAYHEPQRLLTVVYAPRSKVNTIIERQDILKKLFFNGWVMLVILDPLDENAYQLDRQGNWHLLS